MEALFEFVDERPSSEYSAEDNYYRRDASARNGHGGMRDHFECVEYDGYKACRRYANCVNDNVVPESESYGGIDTYNQSRSKQNCGQTVIPYPGSREFGYLSRKYCVDDDKNYQSPYALPEYFDADTVVGKYGVAHENKAVNTQNTDYSEPVNFGRNKQINRYAQYKDGYGNRQIQTACRDAASVFFLCRFAGIYFGQNCVFVGVLEFFVTERTDFCFAAYFDIAIFTAHCPPPRNLT